MSLLPLQHTTMSDFGRHLVRYSQEEAYRSGWRYWAEQGRRSNEATMRWILENRVTIDYVFTTAFFVYLGWWLLGCYRSRCAITGTEETSTDKKRLRNELASVDHAMAALNELASIEHSITAFNKLVNIKDAVATLKEQRASIILKLKRD